LTGAFGIANLESSIVGFNSIFSYVTLDLFELPFGPLS
jgi:hypothetical protein